jgi:[CysO sulfur-carrier protein]-S-L-cysteine hydrolase
MIQIDKQIWPAILDQAIAEYPNEACGFLAGPTEGREASTYYPCRNIYDEMHTKDSDRYPRTAKTAYLIDSKEQQAVFDAVEKEGLSIKSIVHSHPDHDAYFSEEDKLVAAPWGEPSFPEISYLVISIWNGKFKEANEFIWDVQKKDFIGRKLF